MLTLFLWWGNTKKGNAKIFPEGFMVSLWFSGHG
jgi:hypothetical protein